MLFSGFEKHTAQVDVWAFGMILYCILFGKKPASFYRVYRDWYMKSHGHDVELSTLPFIPPSTKNFIYDPFSIDENNPFSNDGDYEELINHKVRSALNLEEEFQFEQSDKPGKSNGAFDFENFIQCIEGLSYSSMFSSEG